MYLSVGKCVGVCVCGYMVFHVNECDLVCAIGYLGEQQGQTEDASRETTHHSSQVADDTVTDSDLA